MKLQQYLAVLMTAPTAPHARKSRLCQLLRDCRAVAAVEFAIVLPIMCTVVFGLYDLTSGVITYMKVSDAANTVSNLIGQVSTTQGGVGNRTFDNYYIAGQLVMYPNAPSNLGLAIANIYYDNSGANPRVAWSVQRGGAAAIANSMSYVDATGSANSSTLVVRASYTYASPLKYFFSAPIVITSTVTGEPRNLLPPAYTQGIPCPPPRGSQSCS